MCNRRIYRIKSTHPSKEGTKYGRQRPTLRSQTFLTGRLQESISRLTGPTFLLGVILLGFTPCRAWAAEVPVVNAGLGPCTADFTVTDFDSRPLYNAKISVKIDHGLLSLRKTNLEVGTNGEGKARVEGLPDRSRRSPLLFSIRYGNQTKNRLHDPALDCHPHFLVLFQDKRAQ